MTQVLNIKPRAPKRAVTLTDGAVTKINELLTAEGDRLTGAADGGPPRGCSGFSYEMFFDSEIEGDDVVEEYGGARVVDPQSLDRLRGSVLDYKEGLMEGGFAINNPNVSRSCGCGNSFS